MMKKHSFWESDFCLVFPSIITISCILYLIFFDVPLPNDINRLITEISENLTYCILSVVVYIVASCFVGFIPIIIFVVFQVIMCSLLIVLVPYDFIINREFVLFAWLLFLFGFANIIAAIKAFKFDIGKFESDSTYVSGSHYEATFQSSGNIKIEEVNEYSGGGEWIFNILLYCIRFYAILITGFPIYLFRKIKQHK